MATWEASISVITAPARSAMKRSPLGPIVRSCGEIMAHEGSAFQPTGPDGSPKPTAEPGRCETAAPEVTALDPAHEVRCFLYGEEAALAAT